ncbi:MAG TPA: hypothetical protein VJ521_13860 [Acidobacteriota bacterium]|nr:hypothetical protein [Acidobacteriota bacterium]
MDPIACIRNSWELYKSQFTDIFIASLVIVLLSSVLGAVPYLGSVASLILNGVFYGGLFHFYLKRIRGQKAEIAEVFTGFQLNPGQLMLGGAVPSLLTLLAAFLPALPFLIAFIPAAIVFSESSERNIEILTSALGAFAIVSLLVCIAVGAFCFLIWMFTLPLIVDKKLDFWQAMEMSRKTVMRNFLKVLGLSILAGLISISGVLLCCIGVLLTMPIGFGAVAFAYEDLFGSKSLS